MRRLPSQPSDLYGPYPRPRVHVELRTWMRVPYTGQVLDVKNRRCLFLVQCPLMHADQPPVPCKLINSHLYTLSMQHACLILTHAACPIPGQVFKPQGVNCPGNPATCENPFPACPLPIKPGCECPTGQVIDEENNRCVFLKQCLPIPVHADQPPVPCKLINSHLYTLSMQHACLILTHAACPIPGQVFKPQGVNCPGNPATCENPFPACPLPIKPGCECPTGQVIDEENNRCVFLKQCLPIPVHADQPPVPCKLINSHLYTLSMQHACLILTHAACPIPGQVFKPQGVNCPGNPATCENPFPACPLPIKPGCECPTGQVIDEENNRCVFLKQCLPIPVHADQPPVPCKLINSHLYTLSMQHACLILTHAACPIPGQVFKPQGVNCPGNPATCENPFPACPLPIKPGCECPTGQVIDEENNRCVFLKQCAPQT